MLKVGEMTNMLEILAYTKTWIQGLPLDLELNFLNINIFRTIEFNNKKSLNKNYTL